MRGVHFDFNKGNIRPDAAPILDEAADILSKDPGSPSTLTDIAISSAGSRTTNGYRSVDPTLLRFTLGEGQRREPAGHSRLWQDSFCRDQRHG